MMGGITNTEAEEFESQIQNRDTQLQRTKQALQILKSQYEKLSTERDGLKTKLLETEKFTESQIEDLEKKEIEIHDLR